MKYYKLNEEIEKIASETNDKYLNVDFLGLNPYGNYLFFLVPGALLTEKELEKITKKYKYFKIEIHGSNFLQGKEFTLDELKNEVLQEVEISKNKTCFFFGFRFKKSKAV